MSTYGVTPSGFIRKPFNAIESDNENKARELFDPNVDLSVYSPIGVFVKMLSWKENVLWQELEKAYYCNWLDSADGDVPAAEGVNLDKLVKWGGLTRKPAQKALVKGVVFLGAQGTYIREGFVVETLQSIGYETIRDAEIDSEFSITLTCKTTQGLDIVSVPETFRIAEGMSVEGTGIPAGVTIESINPDFTIKLSAIVPETEPGPHLPEVKELTFRGPAAFVDCRALIAGKSNMIVSNSLTEIVSSPKDGIEKVFNPLPSVNGRDQETDSELRARYKEEGAEGVGSSISAIQNALKELDSVEYIAVFENTTMSPDAQERPAKSVECIVESDEEHDLEIATAIFDTKPAGIATVGEINVKIKDEYNPDNEYEIKFNRPVPLNVFVRLSVNYTGQWEDLDQNTVRQNIVNYISGVEMGGYIQPWRIAAANSNIEEIDDMSVTLETQGYQEISSVTAEGHKKFEPDTACLLDPGTYSMDVTINGSLQPLSIAVQTNATWSDVIKSINNVLTGAKAAILYGRIRITSNSHGAASTVLIEGVSTNDFLIAIENKWQADMDLSIKDAVPGSVKTAGSKLQLESRELAKCKVDQNYIIIEEANE